MKILFGHKQDEPIETEVLITEVEDRIPAATIWAEANGYVVRIAEVNLNVAPQFGANLIAYLIA